MLFLCSLINQAKRTTRTIGPEMIISAAEGLPHGFSGVQVKLRTDQKNTAFNCSLNCALYVAFSLVPALKLMQQIKGTHAFPVAFAAPRSAR